MSDVCSCGTGDDQEDDHDDSCSIWRPAQPCPECAAGKHDNCDGTTWDDAADAPTDCPCDIAGHGMRRDPTFLPGVKRSAWSPAEVEHHDVTMPKFRRDERLVVIGGVVIGLLIVAAAVVQLLLINGLGAH